ncbi:MAG: hypothetical protein PHE61_00450 [Candidatus Omnitrophica bacterium]|nr:hypothetical protein [Candidatus Omnitrophota bacterium]
MKKLQMVLVILLAAFVVFQGTAFAALIRGKVVSVTTNSLTISETDKSSEIEKISNVTVDTTTTMLGVAAVTDLKAGDEVLVDAEQDATGALKAVSVKTASSE